MVNKPLCWCMLSFMTLSFLDPGNYQPVLLPKNGEGIVVADSFLIFINQIFDLCALILNYFQNSGYA